MFRVLQLADAAFPSGGFAHSAGLEAAAQLGEVADVRRFAVDVVWQAAWGALPFVRRGHAAGADVSGPDAEADAFLLGHVQNRASRAQGRALAATCARAFGAAPAWRFGHLAPVLGGVCALAGLSRDDAERVALHGAARAVLGAAVRLGRLGPLEAQAVHAALPLEEARRSAPDEPAQTAPLVELLGGLHDTLYSRLFQS
jgi:urease accessory protein